MFQWCTYISRLLSQRRWFRFAACSTLLTMVTLVAFMEELSKTYEFHTRPYRSPPEIVLPLTSVNHSLFPLDKPLIDIHDVRPEKQGERCRQYFAEAVLHRTVKLNVFNAEYSDLVCLITHFTPSRIDMFKNLLQFWKGPISTALYVENRDYITVKDDLEVLLREANRTNVFMHTVIKDGEYYPINYLRNLAMRSVPGCVYQFLTDIDFMPSPDLHTVLSNYHLSGLFNSSENMVLVIPAFSALQDNNTNLIESLPKTKNELLNMWDKQKLQQFHPNGNGHRVTDYAKWKQSKQPYEIEYEEGYEPYILIPQATAPYFVDLFLQRYGNKVSYFVELNARRFKFLVVPDGYVIHLPHPTQDSKRLFQEIGSCSFHVFKTLKSRLRQIQRQGNNTMNYM